MNIKQTFMNWIAPDLTTPRGNYHATMFTPENKPYKLFLMVDGQGLGTLVINASTVVNLNQTSTDMVYQYVHGAGLEGITRFINRKYSHAKESASADFESLLGDIEGLLSVEDLGPISLIDGGEQEEILIGNDRYGLLVLDPFSGTNTPEPSFWKEKINELVTEGFPKIHLMTRQMLGYEGLEDLVAYTEEIGVVCALISMVKEHDKEMIARLMRVGLDQLILPASKKNEITQGTIRWLNEQDLYFDVILDLEELGDDPNRFVEDMLAKGVRHFTVATASDRIQLEQLWQLISKAGGTLHIRPMPIKFDGANLTRSEIGNVVLGDGLRYIG